MASNRTLQGLNTQVQRAVAHYWQTRTSQRTRQEQSGRTDQGLRSAVTGGAHMDGFVDLFADLIVEAGIPREFIFRNSAVELPGFFRPTKELTTGLKKPWEAPLICGRRFANTPF